MFVKTVLTQLFVLIQVVLSVSLLVVWGALVIAFIAATLACLFFGLSLVLMRFVDSDTAAAIATVATCLSVPLVIWCFVSIVKKEANWLFGW